MLEKDSFLFSRLLWLWRSESLLLNRLGYMKGQGLGLLNMVKGEKGEKGVFDILIKTLTGFLHSALSSRYMKWKSNVL